MGVRERINKHKRTIHKGLVELPVAKHFVESRRFISQLRFMVTESVAPLSGGDREKLLRRKELRWIRYL